MCYKPGKPCFSEVLQVKNDIGGVWLAAYLLLDVIIAYILDLILGDPYWAPHPVRFIGWLIKRTENILRNIVKNSKKQSVSKRRAGVVLTVFVVSVTFLSVFFILWLAALIHPSLFHILNIYFIYTSFAARCLANEAKKVHAVLVEQDIPEARKRLAMLVGRETAGLGGQEIIRGVVETTAENTVDGIMSPVIYAVLGSLFGIGAPLVYAFKAISTLDSMVGYMNEKYLDLGRFSARTDDVANYLPARLSGLLIPLSALFCGESMKNSFLIMKRDRRNHKSPNCAYPEAAVAGALGVRLGGNNVYFGKLVEKPAIGDADRELKTSDIPAAVRLMYAASLLTLILCTGVAVLFVVLIWQ
jgi:adenosylcobinamide-phosphate synthase